ncbi:MAG: ABC transporter ATP-binding protein [Proteobacteria bacterium]|nr:ABC transporter ATP-binding protein [Pseudomonadota bacterium]MBU1418528.1 ABC transporter ATP-binding protein [Pseudomonadota bacterium]MBU1453190.1 ABC transporter ATP-binding protein [Pseudomonadota bacterium]
MPLIIKTEHVSKYYNRHKPDEVRALDDVSLTIAQGEALVLNGASGSGKTTLLSLIGCMARPTSGSVSIQDKEVSKLPERFLTDIRRQTFGFIFQQLNLIRNISVMENIQLPLYPSAIPMREMNRRAIEILTRLNILNKARMKVSALSGGEQQRVAIARALINQPQIIIADEPTAHLDSSLAAELLEILSELNRGGKTVVIATHDPYVSRHRLIDRIIRMRDGRIIGGSEP